MSGGRPNRLETVDPKPAKRSNLVIKQPSAPVPKAPTEAEAWAAVRQTGVPV